MLGLGLFAACVPEGQIAPPPPQVEVGPLIAGEPVRLELEPGVPVDSQARREAAERARRQAEAEQVIRDDPAVLELMRQFKTARIVAGSIKPV